MTNDDALFRRLTALDEWYLGALPDSAQNLLGRSLLAADSARGAARYRFLLPEKCRNSTGAAHGGAVSTVFDNALSLLAAGIAGETARMLPTVSLGVSFFQPVPVGRPLLVAAETLHRGTALLSLRAELFAGDGADAPLAAAEATFFNRRNH